MAQLRILNQPGCSKGTNPWPFCCRSTPQYLHRLLLGHTFFGAAGMLNGTVSKTLRRWSKPGNCVANKTSLSWWTNPQCDASDVLVVPQASSLRPILLDARRRPFRRSFKLGRLPVDASRGATMPMVNPKISGQKPICFVNIIYIYIHTNMCTHYPCNYSLYYVKPGEATGHQGV